MVLEESIRLIPEIICVVAKITAANNKEPSRVYCCSRKEIVALGIRNAFAQRKNSETKDQ